MMTRGRYASPKPPTEAPTPDDAMSSPVEKPSGAPKSKSKPRAEKEYDDEDYDDEEEARRVEKKKKKASKKKKGEDMEGLRAGADDVDGFD